MITLPQQVQKIIDTLGDSGFEAYAVGGSVRDLIMNSPTKGWDFTTNATPEQILSIFPDSFYDNQFGTVGIKIRNHNNNQEIIDIYEITTYRSEKGYKDHRHPDQLSWGKSIQEDLSRRDFTINAIATDGITIIDPYDGQKDLEQKIIKAVGDPNARFTEDALRIMRAIRFAAQLGFTLENQTLLGIKNYVLLLTKISPERIRDELFKLIAAPFAADAILILKNTGILHIILPEIEECFTVQQKSPKRHHIYDVGTHSIMALKYCPSSDVITKLATLLHDIGKPKTFHQDQTGLITFYNHEVVGSNMAKTISDRLRLSKKQRDKLITLIRWHQFSVDERQTDSALRRFIRRVTIEYLFDMLALRIGDRLGGGAQETSWRLELFKKRLEEVQKQPFSISDLKINGHDVMAEFDCPPGPIVGHVLNQIFSQVEEGTLANQRENLLTKIKELKISLPPISS